MLCVVLCFFGLATNMSNVRHNIPLNLNGGCSEGLFNLDAFRFNSGLSYLFLYFICPCFAWRPCMVINVCMYVWSSHIAEYESTG